MEVHHHSHTSRKKWSHYLWEFFMLFMAVTLGFFVENQREHYIEKQRGVKYVRSFVDDLVQDTSYFSGLLAVYQEKENALDSIFECYDTVTGKIYSNACLLGLAEHSTGFPDFVYTDRTLQQLKNAGGLRLLNTADADSIANYDVTVRSMQVNETTELQETQTLLRSIMYELFNFSAQRGVTAENKIPILSEDNKHLINKYFNVLFHYRWVIQGQIYFFKRLITRATSLISYFKKEHHFK
jgi:hypothetical protein